MTGLVTVAVGLLSVMLLVGVVLYFVLDGIEFQWDNTTESYDEP